MTSELSLPSAAEITEELAKALQGALLERTPGAMSGEEALAAGERVAKGEGLPEEIAGRLGKAPACTLVAFDADRIQGWVFASERVQVAAGASKVLDELNRAVRDGKIVSDLQRKNRGRGLQGVLYSAAGGGLLVADTHFSEDDLERQVEEWLEDERRSHGLTFTVVARRLHARDLRPTTEGQTLAEADDPLGRFEVLDGLGGALVRLQVEVRRRKEEQPSYERRTRFEERSGEPLERCPSCGRRPPRNPPVLGDDPNYWCSRCQGLRRYWREQRQPGEAALERDDRPLTFEDLAEASPQGRGYLAFLAVDGNSMGAVVQGVRTLLELRAFSEATTRIYESARRRAVELLPGFLKDDWPADEAHLSLLSGGDEITLVLPASAAPRVAVDVLRAIEEGFDEATGPGGLLAEAFAGNPTGLERLRRAGAGAGLVAAQSSFPVRLLRRYAGELQRRAKGACAEADGPRSGLGWLLLTDSSPLPEGTKDEHRGEDVSVTAFAERLEEVAAAMEERLPRAALQRLIDQGRQEEESIRTLDPAPARDAVLAPLLANFFRYQLVRNSRLAAWWKKVEPPDVKGQEDGVLRWLRAGGVPRLERLAELLSLAPVPRERKEGPEVREVSS
ncbi:MAG TPA: hypothetical protein VLF66_11430 [Thermoanaerobaculia bacterium]|nr:hypothetical protein [Thermoanaerobaculia bacterium]